MVYGQREARVNLTGLSFNDTIELVCTECLVATVNSKFINAADNNNLRALKDYLPKGCPGNNLSLKHLTAVMALQAPNLNLLK